MTDPEKLIDSVLRGYSDSEPRAGWEGRILARASRPRVGPWLGLVPAFAIALFLVVRIHRPDPVQPKLSEIAMVARSMATPIAPIARARVRRIHKALPKRRVFPTPAPLTGEERALLSIAESNLLPIVDSGSIQITPIQIAVLEQEN